MSTSPPAVVVIGGGWAGMAAALQLHHHGRAVHLYESARQYGGRARSVEIQGHRLDNGQHLLIGAYRESLRLMAQIGLDEKKALLRQPLSLHVWGKAAQLQLQPPTLPAPLHLAIGLLQAKGVSLAERLAALRMALKLRLGNFRLPHDTHDISVAELLQQHRQGRIFTEMFWEPLCLATLNTPMAEASAQVFLNVLRDSFSQHRRDAELLIPKVGLGELFCETAAAYLQETATNRLSLSRRVDALHIANNALQGIEIDGAFLPCQEIILATSPREAARLLAPHPPLQATAKAINGLDSQPIVTAYLHYPTEVSLPAAMIGLHGGIAQWLTDRRHAGQPGVIAVTISAEGEHMGWDKEKLCRRLQQEIAQHFPHWPPAQQCQLIREKHATFACRVGVQDQRPAQQAAVQGLWLAGDYTAGDYPATLEGAVRSGVQCADYILQTRNPSA